MLRGPLIPSSASASPLPIFPLPGWRRCYRLTSAQLPSTGGGPQKATTQAYAPQCRVDSWGVTTPKMIMTI